MARALITSKTGKALAQIERELDRDPRLKSPHTRRGYRHDLTKFEDWREGRPVSKLLVEEYAAHLQGEGKSPNTVNRALAAIRWWARKVADLAFEGGMAKEEREEIVTQAARVAGVKDVTGERQHKGRHITEGELAALMRACEGNGSAAGVRDAAIMALAWQTGARRSELAGLELQDFEGGEDVAEVKIRGKGDRIRKGYLSNGAVDALSDWLAIRGQDPGPLFYRIRKGGKVLEGKGLSGEALAQMLAKRADQAGVKDMTWHDFRRSFAGNLLDNGVDLVTTQKLLGHKSPTTTSIYDRRGEEVKRKAVKSLHVPYRRRMV